MKFDSHVLDWRVEQAARLFAENDARWMKKDEPISWDAIELMLVSGVSKAEVARRFRISLCSVKHRRARDFWPMETAEQRDLLRAVLGRAVALRREWTTRDGLGSCGEAVLVLAEAPRALPPVPVVHALPAPVVEPVGDGEQLAAAFPPSSRAFGARDQTPWGELAHAAQLPPEGAWRTWLMMGGRGAGKTRAGAEWVRGLVESGLVKRIALVGPTLHDVREVMIDGPSGLRAIAPDALRPTYEVTRRRLIWPPAGACEGAVAFAFSAEDPDSLRGPQFDLAWCDEIGAWAKDVKTWDTLAFGMRLGPAPRIVATTTPRPRALVKLLAGKAEKKRSGVAITRAGTRENAANLAPDFVSALEEDYAGTELGRQELDGELIEDLEGALWSRAMIEATRARADEAEGLTRVVVAVDPPAGASGRSDACGIVAAGVKDGVVYVLQDATVRGQKPADWAARVMSVARAWSAACVVAESNQGGEMVRDVLRNAGVLAGVDRLRVVLRYARVSKRDRAEPVSTLYATGRVRHVRVLKELEDEMCSFGVTQDGARRKSPDRVDALVWAVDELMRKVGRPKAGLD